LTILVRPPPQPHQELACFDQFKFGLDPEDGDVVSR